MSVAAAVREFCERGDRALGLLGAVLPDMSLPIAAWLDDADEVRLLAPSSGRSALDASLVIAVCRCSERVFPLLLEAGADPAAFGSEALVQAACYGEGWDLFGDALLRRGAEPRPEALWEALQFWNTDAVIDLLESGVPCGEQELAMAASYGDVASVRRLLHHGAPATAWVLARAMTVVSDHNSWALDPEEDDYADIVRLLLEAGGEPCEEAVAVARLHGRADIVALLEGKK